MSFGIITKTKIELSAPLVTVLIYIITVLCSLCNINIALVLMGISMIIELVFIVAFYMWNRISGVNNSNHVVLFLFYKICESTLLWQVLSLILTEYLPIINLTHALLIVMAIFYGAWIIRWITAVIIDVL